jgi:hypothetical protein
MRDVRIPPAKGTWCKEARDWYNSLKTSGQSDYYQNSDWQMARICGDLITHVYEAKFYRMTMMIAEINSMMAKLGTSEGDRRQTMRVELDLPEVEELSEEDEAENHYENVLGFPSNGTRP